MLAILHGCIKTTKFGTWKSCWWIWTSDQQIDDFGTFSSAIVTGWSRWCAGQRCHPLWSWQSTSVRWRYSCSFECPVCLRILCSAILARKASGHVVLTKYSHVSFYPSLHVSVARKFNTLLRPFSNLGVWFLTQTSSAKCKSVRKPHTISQTLLYPSPVLLSTSRCSRAPLELCNVLSDYARAFSGAPESTCCYGCAFRTLRDLTITIVKCWSGWNLRTALWETWCHILNAVFLRVQSKHGMSSICLCYSYKIRYLII